MAHISEYAGKLAGKVALVTGAGRGIGRAIALAYASAGAAVSCAARTQAEIDSTAMEIHENGGQAIAIWCDVTDWESVSQLLDNTVSTLGGVDIVVVNAGLNLSRDHIERSERDDWKTTFSVNLVGAYHTIRAAIPHLRTRGGGKIITMGSGMGHKGRAGSSAYCCSKAALWMLTRVTAQELWEYNISVNELIPGPVETRIAGGERDPNSVFGIDSEWIKTPEEVAPLALFLACQPALGPTAQSFSLMRRDN